MNIDKIGVNKYPISQVLDTEAKTIFEIPKYQREYTWGTREWETLFDDLMENDTGYFLGSIICINYSNDDINVRKYEVVDGQQRLTSISLLLAALYTSLNEYKDLLDEDQNSDMLQIKHRLVLKKTQSDIRVIPQIQGSNYDDYIGLLAKVGIIPKQAMPKFSGLRRIVKAYNYFKMRIENVIDEAEDKVSAIFKILEKVNTAILVVIEVSNHADAYTLFESLNNRGTPLTSVDLIKNLLLARLEASGAGNIDYGFSRWTEIIDDLGSDYSDQERFFRQNYNAFRKELNAPFYKGDRQYPLGTIAVRSTLLDIYEKIISRDPMEALEELCENAAIYGSILLNKDDGISEERREAYLDLRLVQGAPSYLLIMYLIKNQGALDIEDADIVKVCRLLVNFFVRRNMTDIPPTRDLTRMFMTFVEAIEQNEYQGEEIYLNLRNVMIGAAASDEVFEEKLRGPVYDDNTSATRFILCMMAKSGMTRENKQDLWEKTNSNQYVWSIEHIFPQGQNIPDSWVDMIADGDREKAKEYQAQYVHTFGNLTITGYNSALSNKAFTDKKNRKDNRGNYIGYRNGLNLNADVCDKEKWTVDIIKARTEHMVKEIMEMFAL